MQPNNRNTPVDSSQKLGYQSPLNQYTQQPKSGDDNSPFYKSAAPSISLPKGGGALKGIDEKFSVNAVNGTAGMEIPLPLSPGRSNFTPALSLSYNSGSGNSEFGLGWGLSLPSIQRKTDKKLPQYNDVAESDVFLLAGAEDLVPELDGSGNPVVLTPTGYTIKRYRPRIEGLFARIEHITKAGSTGSWWRITTKDNITTYYGLTNEGRITNPELDQNIYKWLPQLTIDYKGNVQQYNYIAEDDRSVPKLQHEKNRLNSGPAKFTNTYLKSVQYCNKIHWPGTSEDLYDPSASLPLSVDFLMEAVLDYGDHSTEYGPTSDQEWACRSDAFSDYHAGFEIRTYRKCKRVLMFHYFTELDGKNLVRSLELTYQQDGNPALLTEADFITFATQRGYEYKNSAWHNKALPAMSFNYQPLEWNTNVQSVDKTDFQGAPQGLTGPYQWTDFAGEGISGILTEQGTGWFYKSNLGDGHFAPPMPIAQKPSFHGLGKELQWADLDADGRRQVVTDGQIKGFWELDDDQHWESFRTFPKNINVDKNSPFTKMLDLDGDGRADLLITEDRAWTWYQNEGKQGFDLGGYAPVFRDEEKGPVLLLRDSVQSIFLADMSGDGMTDLVRITNGSVCYWPNMGYGKFGAKVDMIDAPFFHYPDQYNPIYLLLADISGTGAADLIFIGKDNKCSAWINLSGNGFSEAKEIANLPGTDLQSKIAVLDFLGNGTGCIVWSSPLPQHNYAPMRYIDLMGGNKPYLMCSYSNGMGKTVSVTYKSSTHFYLEDKAAGKPWATKLPFPVHCIENITTSDSVSDTRYTQIYRYRHGYYDHEEREFRGFGYVETRDIDAALLTAPDPLDPAQNTYLDQKPVLTKTWNHTGAWLREQTLLDAFKQEYYQFEGWDDITVIAEFESNLSAQELREAHRALKGSPLRQEIYALDGNLQLQDIPYTIAANAYAVKRIQKQAGNRYASFINHQLEKVTFSCERNPDDPRVTQQLTLEEDEYGNVLQGITIAYPRKHTDTNLPQKVQDEQAIMHVTYTQNSFTNDAIDSHQYHLRVLAVTKAFEVLGLSVPTGLWTKDVWTTEFTNVTVPNIDFSASATGAKEKRLISNARTIYKDNDGSDTPLALNDLQSLAIPHEHYQLAFTDGILGYFDTDTESGVVDSSILLASTTDPGQGAGYVLLDDGNWWLPSGTAVYTDSTFTDPAAQFYTPLSFKDPWQVETKVGYWSDYWLLPETVTDAKENVNTVTDYDWRILQPTRMMDVNLNISTILYDALGLPVAMAVKGKDDPLNLEGDTLDGLDNYSSGDLTAQSGFFTDPVLNADTLLGDATWRCVYDLDVSPVAVGMIARQHHVNNPNLTTGQSDERLIRLTYTDGMGRVLMLKEQCAANSGNDHKSWIGSGRTVYNNKGNAVMQFEPYFSSTPLCDTATQATAHGVSPKLFYDPLNRVYKTEMPDGTFTKTVWTAWEQTIWDQNDTVKDSDWYAVLDALTLPSTPLPTAKQTADFNAKKDTKTKAEAHYNTPTVVHTDSQARPFYTIVMDSSTSYIHSYAELDIMGNRIAIIDGNNINSSPLVRTLQYKYNLLKQVYRQESIDGGTGRILIDVSGQTCYHWDADDREFYTVYDILRRPVEQWVDDGTTARQFEKTIYLDTDGVNAVKNLRGKTYQHYDGGGKHYIEEYDFKGLPVAMFGQLIDDYKRSEPDWNAGTPPPISGDVFETSATADALGRPVIMTVKGPSDSTGHVTRHVYDEGGMLKAVYLTPESDTERCYVQDIHYNAKGQRRWIWYGNATKTKYTYDANTFRLVRLHTINLNPSPHEVLQDLNYYYDAVGNITSIRDDAQPTLFYSNTIIEPIKDYYYDSLYRLIRAAGTEQIGLASFGSDDNYNDAGNIIGTANAQAVQNYNQIYTYDAVGNMLTLTHNGDDVSTRYTRTFSYGSASNRLETTAVGSDPAYTYTHDARGNMTAMPHMTTMDWDSLNQLCYVEAGSCHGYYQYSGGQRVLKVVEKPGDITEERIYLGSYERYRKYVSGTVEVERITLHVNDGTGRIAMLEKRTYGTSSDDNGTDETLIRFVYSNHLQSASLELNENGNIISYEEYHPYGTTSYQAMSATIKAAAKRYRFTGKERDEESGLNYHDARYYAPWLCRWISVDPLESKYAGWSSYNYVTCNPINETDSTGKGKDGDNTKSILPNKMINGVENASYRDHVTKTIDKDGNATTTVTGNWAPTSEHREFEGTEVEEIKYPKQYLVNDGNLKNIVNYLPTKIHDFIPAQKETGPVGDTSVGITGIDLLNYGEEGTSAFFLSGLRGLRNNSLKAEARAKGEATYDRQIFISDERGTGIISIQAPAFDAPIGQILVDADMFTLAGSSSPAAIFAKGSAVKPSLLTKVVNIIGESPAKPDEIINGCEAVAKKLQKVIGGEFLQVTPPEGARFVGNVEYAGQTAPTWYHHVAVIKDGLVYDKMTGSAGMTFTDYVAMFKDNPIFTTTSKITLK